jgi:hypothetical protein
VDDCIVEEAKTVARALVEAASAQRTVLRSFLDCAEHLKRKFEEKHRTQAEFLKDNRDIFFLRLFEEADWDKFYRLGVDATGQPMPVDTRNEYESFIHASLGGNAGLLDLIGFFEREAESGVDALLGGYTEKRFWIDFDSHPRLINVLDHPSLKDRLKRAQLIQRLILSARPLLRQGELPGAEGSVGRHVYLGICDPDAEPYRSFVGELMQQLEGIKGITFDVQKIATGRPDEIYLYTSAHAFALPALPIVSRECHDAYAKFYTKLADSQVGGQTAIPLHLSTQWEGRFDDLKVYSADEARKTHEIRNALLFGTILKVLNMRQVQRQVFFQYRLGPPHHTMVPLGARRTAMTILRQKDDVRAMLTNAIQQRERSVTLPQRVALYWAIQACLNSPEIKRGMPDHTLLFDKLTEVYGQIPAAVVESSALDDIKTIPEEERWEHIRDMQNSGLEWFSGTLPMIEDLDLWTKPSASATTT